MDDAQILGALSPLMADIIESAQFPAKGPLLSHYTNIETVEKIITNKEVWFSNPLFMNDVQEVSFGLLESDRFLRENLEVVQALKTSERATSFFASYNYFRTEYIEKHLPDTFIFCLSEHKADNSDGLLSMWRGYGGNGNGAAIVFDTSKFSPLPTSPLIVAPVEYATTKERQRWITEKLDLFASIITKLNLPDDKLYLAAHSLFHRFKLFAFFTKHVGFHEEQEWRVVYMRERDPADLLGSRLSHLIGAKGIEPKLKLKLSHTVGVTADDISLSRIVDRIILGPSISSPIALSTFKRLLNQHNEPEIAQKIFSSTIPFRKS